jgi:Carboxypeptidase regulatory-like domain
MSGASITIVMRVFCVLVVLAASCFGQSSTQSKNTNAWIRGTVLGDLTGEPLTRARVLLRSVSGETGNVAVECDQHGKFTIPNVIPGKYSISAERDGYLPSTAAQRAGSRLPAVIQIESGKSLGDVTVRLKPWSVISGRIRFSDAEPAIGVLVQMFQRSFARGRQGFRMVSFTRTNDRGEYRAAGLSPGSYYVAASYDRPLPAQVLEADSVDESGKPLPQFRYATTFYPAALKLADAVPLHVSSAQEAGGIDIFLEPVPTVTIRGACLSGLTGEVVKSPTVSLRRLSSDAHSSINAAISVAPRGGGFEIRGVTSGPYLLVSDSIEKNKRLFAQLPIIVTDANIDDLQVVLEPERSWRGIVKAADAPGVKLSDLRVMFEPRSDLNPIASAAVDSGGGFTVGVVADEVYDAYVVNTPDEVYIKSIRVANTAVDSDGISGRMAGANVPVEIALSSKDGTLAGRVWIADGSLAPGASVTVVPDPPRGRPQYYRTGFADQFGTFQIRGLAPGRYTAYAYYDDAPCEFFDADTLDGCGVQGFGFTAGESTQTILGVRLAK